MLSPHKMVGGPGTPGVLIIKKQLLLNFVPSSPGNTYHTIPYIYSIQQMNDGNDNNRWWYGAIRA